MLLDRFDEVFSDSDTVEVILINDVKALNIEGPKHLLVDNTKNGAGSKNIIIRYYYADIKESIYVQKSVDTDIENLVVGNTTKHIILQNSWFTEIIKVTAIMENNGEDTIISGKLLSPTTKDTTESEHDRDA